MVSSTSQVWGAPATTPPELSTLLHQLISTNSACRGGSTMFSYSKCDSFALALTFYNALLPPDHKFIGSNLNFGMSRFTTEALVTSFPVPPPPSESQRGTHRLLVDVLVAMMHPDKSSRMSALDAISALH
ncbi:hypothetical protein Pelo_17519 [Pelomyxa schiedti]|nr:hypothetical protein Pelo_17519 [Pelomyxa schiedti]